MPDQEVPIVTTGGDAEHKVQKEPDSKTVEANTAPPVLTFQPTEFLIQESTGRNIGRRGEKRKGMEKREVKFASELTAQYENFLNEHLQNLLNVTNPQVLDNDSHRIELRLREALTTDNKPDKEKIKEYLESPDGWMITTQLFEDVTAEKLFSMGLHAATQPRGDRVEQMDENTIRLHLDQGLLNRAIFDHLAPWLDERVNVTSGRPETRGIAGRFPNWRRWHSIVSNTVGAAAVFGTTYWRTHNLYTAAAASAIVPGLTLLRNSLNSGVEMDLRQCSAALQSIQNNPDEVAYLKAVLGIDVSNFVVTGPNQIGLRPGHALSPNVIRNTQKEIFQGLYAREEFYTSLGIPSEALDALPEQYLYSYNGGRAEQTGTRWQKRLDEIFQPQTNGIRDTAGRFANDPLFLTPNAAGVAQTLDFAGNLRRFTEARRKVMMEMMEGQAIKVKDGEEALDSISRIKEKIKSRKDNGEEMEKRKKVIRDRKILLETERNELSTAKTTTEAFTEAKKSLETAIIEFNREFSTVAIAAAPGVPVLTTIEGEITKIHHDLHQNPPIAGSIAEARMQAKNEISAGTLRGVNSAAVALNAAIAPLDPRVQLDADTRRAIQNAYIEQETEAGKNMLAEVTQRETEAKAQLAKLDELKNKITAAKRALDEKSDVVLGTAKENLTDLQTQYVSLTSWGIGVIELRNLPIEELLTRINAIHAVTPANGWPQAQNSDSATRMRVVNAVAEAKAQFEETFDTQKTVRDPQYVRITGWAGNPASAILPVTPDQLRAMSENQLLILIHNLNTSVPAQGWSSGNDPVELPNLRLAMEEAKNRMIIRHNAAATERIKDLEEQIKAEDKRLTEIKFDDEINTLQVTSDLMLRQGKIFEMSYDMASDSERFTDVTLVNPNDPTFSTTEKAPFDGAVPPVGYWRLMNALFGYETKTDRSVYVSKLLKVLPPKTLARRINTALGMPPGDPNIENITTAFTQLNTKINNKTFTGVDVRSMFRDIINGLRMQADAI